MIASRARIATCLAAVVLALAGVARLDAGVGPPDSGLRIDQVVPLPEQPHGSDDHIIWYDAFDADTHPYAEDSLPWVQAERLGDHGGSRVMRYTKGKVGAGGLKVFFGDSPTYAQHVVKPDRTFDDVYWRVYVKHVADWTGGGPAKLSRATSLVPPGWRQAMIAHVWSSGESLTLDPASGVADGEVVTRKYNDFERLRWLGNKPVSPVKVHSPAEAGRWVCVEARARLNTPGKQDGVNQLWIDGVLQCERPDLDWRGTFEERGINAVFLEGYWNAGSPADQSRWLDDFVISTAPIGPVVTSCAPEIRLRSGDDVTGAIVEIARASDDKAVVWTSHPLPADAHAVAVTKRTGAFAEDGAERLPADALLLVRIGRPGGNDRPTSWSPWHQGFRAAR